MDAKSRRVHSVASFDELPKMLPELKLHHGQTLWLLTELGFRGAATQRTFYEYIKSLRKLGVPFDADEIGHAQRGPSKNYSYYHLMELALALTLRVYHVVPDSVLMEVISHRKRLYGTTDVRMPSAPPGGANLLSSKSTVGRPFEYVGFFWTFSSTSRVGNSSNSVRPSQFRPTRPFPFLLSATSSLGLCSRSGFQLSLNNSSHCLFEHL